MKRKNVVAKKCTVLIITIIAVVMLNGASVPKAASEDTAKKYLENVSVSFNQQELEYISTGKVLVLGNPVTREPLSYLDENGHLRGITYDYMRFIEAVSGLKFSYKEIPAGVNPVDFVVEGNSDIGVGVVATGENLNTSDVRLTDTFFTSQTVFVGKTGKAFDLKQNVNVLTNKSYKMAKYAIMEKFPICNIDYRDDIKSCLDDVHEGGADLVYQNALVLSEYLKRPKYKELSVIPSSVMNERLVLAVSSGVDPIVVSILNKSIQLVPQAFSDELVIDYTISKTYNPTAFEFFKMNLDFAATASVSIICIFISAILSVKLKAKKSIDDEREMYRQLIDDSSEMVFYMDYSTMKMVWTKQFRDRWGYDLPESMYDINDRKLIYSNIHCEDIHLVDKMIDDFRSGKQGSLEKIRIRMKDGSFCWYKLQLRTIKKNGIQYRLVGRLVDIDKQVKNIAALCNASQKDMLTGLYNKKAFEIILNYYIETKKNSKGTLFFVDIDNFKKVNDELGHLKGDEVLKQIASIIKQEFRDDDLVSRFGGDEFTIFISDISPESVREKAANLCSCLRFSVTDETGSRSVDISSSIGISFYPDNGNTSCELLATADSMMYEVKRNGKDSYKMTIDV